MIEEEEFYVVDEIKTTTAPTELLTEDFNPQHWAQAKCYGTFLCEEKQLAGVMIQLTYYQVDTSEIVRHRRYFFQNAAPGFSCRYASSLYALGQNGTTVAHPTQ